MEDFTSITEGKGRTAELFKKAIELRGEFRKQHPELDTLSVGQRRRLWREFLGLKSPQVASANDSERDASCLDCKDTGWVLAKIDTHESQAIPCPNCSHWDEERKQYALQQSGVPDAKRCCNFRSFIPVRGSEEAVEAAHTLSNGTATFNLLLIYGGDGCGKTHLGYAAVLQAIECGKGAIFKHVGDLMNELKLAMMNNTSAALIEELKRCDFLCLDDLGSEQSTDWQASVIEDIINYRYAQEKPLLVTTNYDLKLLSSHLLSRFRDHSISQMVLDEASDYRPKKKPTQQSDKSQQPMPNMIGNWRE